jgi:hypothetical protein
MIGYDRLSKRRFGLGSNSAESFRIVNRNIRQYLPVDFHFRAIHAIDQLAIRQSVQSGSCIDSGDPKCPKLPFALSTVSVLVLASLDYGLHRYAVNFAPGAIVAFGLSQNFLVPRACNDAAFISCHVSISLTVREHAAHALDVAVGYLLGCAQLALTLRLLFRQDMIEMGLGSFEAALTRPAETLGSAPVGFHFRHCLLRFSSLAMYAVRCARTGGY